MPRPEDPGSLPRPHQTGRFPWTSCSLTHSSTATSSFSGLYQHFREYGLPYGLQASLCTLHLPCSRSSQSPYHSGAPPQAQHSIRVGGWALTRRGLAPRKIRQASLGTITPCVSGARAHCSQSKTLLHARPLHRRVMRPVLPHEAYLTLLGKRALFPRLDC